MRICYHGTNAENARHILEDGFWEGTWFAANLQDALSFGGLHVFEVAFNFDEPPNWQFIAPQIPPDRIVRYTEYHREIRFDNDDLRKQVFQSNIGEAKKEEIGCRMRPLSLTPADSELQ